MDQQIQFFQVSYDDRELQLMIESLNDFQISLYGLEMCNLDSIETLRQSRAYILGAYYDEKLIGMGAVKLFDEYAEIKRMFVDAKYRGNNFANRILDLLETYAKRNGKKVACLETGNLQEAAISFYKKCGYCIVEEFGKYKPNNVSVYFKKDL